MVQQLIFTQITVGGGGSALTTAGFGVKGNISVFSTITSTSGGRAGYYGGGLKIQLGGQNGRFRWRWVSRCIDHRFTCWLAVVAVTHGGSRGEGNDGGNGST